MSLNGKQLLLRIIRIVIVAALAVLLSVIGFIFYKINTEARQALRQAKNVKMSLDSVNIELYAEGKSIYDAVKFGGVADGVKEKVGVYVDLKNHETYEITGYDSVKREITGMVFYTGQYQVIYRHSNTKGDSWKVRYILNVMNFTGDED